MSHDHAALYGARPGEAGLVSWRVAIDIPPVIAVRENVRFAVRARREELAEATARLREVRAVLQRLDAHFAVRKLARDGQKEDRNVGA